MAGRTKEAQQPEAMQELPQIETATNTAMPVDLVPDQPAFELAGFSFGQIVGTEYSDVRIPDGWHRVSVGNSQVDIYDETDRRRAEVRCKTATLLPRYRVVKNEDLPGKVTWMVTDNDNVLYSASSGSDDFAGQDYHFDFVSRWMTIRYPRAEDPSAYW